MGAVYRAWDAELGVEVALKVIRPEIAADPTAAAEIERRFKRELLLARQVTHPNIIRIHDLGDIDGIKYITMPFIEGSDLATVLKAEQKLPIARALRIARGAVAGLVSAHQAGVVHRDLKPANIMIGAGDDTPTVMDFGIARSAGGPGQGTAPRSIGTIRPSDLSRTAALAASTTMAGAIVGTVAYMAPEQAKGEAVDQRADIYSFGLILYDMLVGGRRAERAVSAIAELQQRMETAPPPPRSIDAQIPEAVDAIVRRCLEPDLTKRFQTTLELQQALDRLDDNGKPLPILRRVSRRTMIAAAAAVVLLLGGTYYMANWLATPLKEPDPVSVLIADFQNNTGDAALNNALAQTVRRALESASFISAYDRGRLSQFPGVRPPEKLDETAARELAVKQGLGVVLAGTIDPSGQGFAITVKALRTVTGEVITTASNTASSKDQVLETTTRLMARVRNALGDNTSQSQQLFAMRSVSASSLEVVSYYAEAVEAQSKGQFEQARQSYLKAVGLEPTFGLGYQGLAAMAQNQFRQEEAEKYSKEALRYLDGMTERERFATRAFYYTVVSDLPQCVKEYGELLSRYPADSIAHSQRAVCLRRMRKMREAVDEMQQAVGMLPQHVGFRINLALMSNYAGDFEAAEKVVQGLEMDLRKSVALVHSQMGRGLLSEAAQTLEKVRQLNPRAASFTVSQLGEIAVYEGRFAEAIKILEEGVPADLATKSAELAAFKLTSIGFAHLLAGQKPAAAAAAEKALATHQGMPVTFLVARILVETGAVDKARELAATLAKAPGPPGEAQSHGKIIEAEIALKNGAPQDAIKLLTESNAILDSWLAHFLLGRAQLEAGAFVQADSEFDLCITRRGETLLTDEGPMFSQFPLVYYYRGRIREEMKTASFADSYREYLKIRGTSNEDPLVREIRKRIGS
jgi:serine/threonine protein kinase/Flp pilus assembly protein TadD